MAAVGQPRPKPRLGPGRNRPDPVKRHADGVTPLAKLANADPNRSYVWVPAGDKNAQANYQYQGYRVERNRPGGVSPQGLSDSLDPEDQDIAPKPGSFVTGPYGCVLMSVPIERKRSIELEGPDGGSGQRDVDRIERHIVANRGGIDPLRGLTGLRRNDGHEYVTVEKEISRLEPEDELQATE